MQYISLCYKRLYDSLLNKAYAVKPSDEQKPDEDELKMSLTRLGFENIELNKVQDTDK